MSVPRPLLLAISLLGACSIEPRALDIPASSWERLSRQPPDATTRSTRTWYASRSPRMGVYYVQLRGVVVHGGYERSHAGLLVLSGRMRARIGPWSGELGPGSSVVVPPRLTFHLTPLGTEPVVYVETLTPDAPVRGFMAVDGRR